ncbi:MAG: putative b-glycosidase, glycoside hydrolase family 9 protein [Fibrobacterota bacterium]|jgi:hypothetical protein
MLKSFSLVALLSGLSYAGLHINQVGYELDGPKIAVLRDSLGAAPTSFTVKDAAGKVVYTGIPVAQGSVAGWGKAKHWNLDFTPVQVVGKFTISTLPSGLSDTVRIGKDQLFSQTTGRMIEYFRAMRSTDASHRSVAVFGRTGVTRNVYGGWKDASGDAGKYLSHQAGANFLSPQQIPLVDWALMKTWELDSSAMGDLSGTLKDEAGWGADFLLRMLDPDSSFFYMNVFNQWGKLGVAWHLCSWETSAGNFSSQYQTAWREGGGMAIAALARAARQGPLGDSLPGQYLAGAQRAWKALAKNGTLWANDRKQNLIDDYCALLAHVELYKTTGVSMYKDSATARAEQIMKRQQPGGWFAVDDSTRPFYHAVDEGLPIVALLEYLDIAPERRVAISSSLRASLGWYKQLTFEVANPYGYARLYRPIVAASTPSGAVNLAQGKPAWASLEENANTLAAKAFDGQVSAGSRWSAYKTSLQPADSFTASIAVDLGDRYLLDSVVTYWEAAFAKLYSIEVSNDSVRWSLAAKQTLASYPNDNGHASTILPDSTKGRYVRITGLQRGFAYGGYSIMECKVFGRPIPSTEPLSPGKSAFFMPHVNETGYWWQGENARLGSMATAFFLASRKLVPGWDPKSDTLGILAQAQLDWIAGRNPFDLCFIDGFGRKNSPPYGGNPHVPAGISNGITSDASEQGIAFNPPLDTAWQNWRWVEQWIPHNAWWLLGASAGRWARHEPALDTSTSIRSRVANELGLRMVWSGRQGTVRFSGRHPHGIVRMRNLQGRVLWCVPVAADVEEIALPKRPGVNLLTFDGADGRHAALPIAGF